MLHSGRLASRTLQAMNMHCGSKRSIIGAFPLGVCVGTLSLRDRLYVKIIQAFVYAKENGMHSDKDWLKKYA